jgi:hypothetical protein
MEKKQWVTWLMFLQTQETLPQNEEELEIAGGEFVTNSLVFDTESCN